MLCGNCDLFVSEEEAIDGCHSELSACVDQLKAALYLANCPKADLPPAKNWQTHKEIELEKRLADAEKELARYKGAFHGNWTPCRCSCHAPNDPLRLRLQWPCCSVRDASQ